MKAATKEWATRLCDNSRVNLILVADNYWLVATSPTMLSAMTNEWLRLLGEVGWETPTEDHWLHDRAGRLQTRHPCKRRNRAKNGGEEWLQGTWDDGHSRQRLRRGGGEPFGEGYQGFLLELGVAVLR